MDKELTVRGERYEATYKPGKGVLISCEYGIAELTQIIVLDGSARRPVLVYRAQDYEGRIPLPEGTSPDRVRDLMRAAVKGCARQKTKEPISWVFSMLKIPMPSYIIV